MGRRFHGSHSYDDAKFEKSSTYRTKKSCGILQA